MIKIFFLTLSYLLSPILLVDQKLDYSFLYRNGKKDIGLIEFQGIPEQDL